MKLHLFSPAKINLFLRIVSKGDDGYHQLSSIFQTISLGDDLTAEFNENKDLLTCSNSCLPIDHSNLIMKAAELFLRKTGINQHFKFHLTKRIPVEAGLGGGSSNAATALWACNQLTNAHIPQDVLKEWGAMIGSDVPFFFSEGTAYCSGRGEHVYPLPPFANRPLWIIKPKLGLSTPEVYRRLNFSGVVSKEIVQSEWNEFLTGNIACFNDLEKPAFEIFPELSQIKKFLLEKGFETVLMSGSGSAFFCLGNQEISALPNTDMFRAHYLNRSLKNWYTHEKNV
jgi:4-diphosphocytidyl-2-C-methyl-D-erythritol kinase